MVDVLTIRNPSTSFPKFFEDSFFAKKKDDKVFSFFTISGSTMVPLNSGVSYMLNEEPISEGDFLQINKSRQAAINGKVVSQKEVFHFLES